MQEIRCRLSEDMQERDWRENTTYRTYGEACLPRVPAVRARRTMITGTNTVIRMIVVDIVVMVMEVMIVVDEIVVGCRTRCCCWRAKRQ